MLFFSAHIWTYAAIQIYKLWASYPQLLSDTPHPFLSSAALWYSYCCCPDKCQCVQGKFTIPLPSHPLVCKKSQLIRARPTQPAHGISLIMVDAGTPGFTKGRNLKKLGLKAQVVLTRSESLREGRESMCLSITFLLAILFIHWNKTRMHTHAQDTSELFFDNVRVPASNILGLTSQSSHSIVVFLCACLCSCSCTCARCISLEQVYNLVALLPTLPLPFHFFFNLSNICPQLTYFFFRRGRSWFLSVDDWIAPGAPFDCWSCWFVDMRMNVILCIVYYESWIYMYVCIHYIYIYICKCTLTNERENSPTLFFFFFF